MNKFGLVSLALACSALAAPLTWDRLIASADEDPRFQSAQQRTTLAASGHSNTKLWDKLELRYKLDGFSFAKHDFELRITPRAFGEGSADRAHWDAQSAYAKSYLDVERGSLMYDRYERGIHYLMRQRLNALTKELYQVNLDRIQVLQLMSGSANFDSQDLMAAIERDAELRAELISDSTSLANATNKLRQWVADFDSVALDTSWLPSMEDVISQLEGGLTVDEKYPLIAMAANKMKEEKSKTRQDLAGERDYISHIGIGYSLQIESLTKKYKDLDADDVAPGKTYDKYYDEYWDKRGPDGIGTIRKLVPDVDNRRTADKFFANLAFRLPFFDSNKDNELRTQVADLNAEGDYLDKVRDVNLKVAHIVEEVNALIAQWKVQKDFIEKVNAGSIMEQFAKVSGPNPLLLLKARESAISMEIKSVKLETEIYSRYLSLLQYAGVLSVEGNVNHLQKGLK